MTHRLPVTGNTEHTRPENRAFYPALDGLRAVALLMVFGTHYGEMPFGWSGVDVFFVLSGFLITGILFDTRDDAHRVRNFYVRRTLRIFPLYYAVMLALFLSSPVMHWHFTWGWLAWPLYLGNYVRFVRPYAMHSPLQLMSDFQPTAHAAHHKTVLYLGHCWSLCVEEQFYLMWPWVVFRVRDRRKLIWICALSLPVCLLLRWLASMWMPPWMVHNGLLYSATPLRLDALLLGGLLALLLRGSQSQSLLRLNRVLFPIVTGAVLLCALLAYSNLVHGFHPADHFSLVWGLTVLDVIAAVVLVQAIQPGTVVYRVLGIAPLRWLGRISYGAYVLHDILHVSISRIVYTHLHRDPTRMTAIVGFAVMILGAWLSFRFFESPFLNLKERWTVRG